MREPRTRRDRLCAGLAVLVAAGACIPARETKAPADTDVVFHGVELRSTRKGELLWSARVQALALTRTTGAFTATHVEGRFPSKQLELEAAHLSGTLGSILFTATGDVSVKLSDLLEAGASSVRLGADGYLTADATATLAWQGRSRLWQRGAQLRINPFAGVVDVQLPRAVVEADPTSTFSISADALRVSEPERVAEYRGHVQLVGAALSVECDVLTLVFASGRDPALLHLEARGHAHAVEHGRRRSDEVVRLSFVP